MLDATTVPAPPVPRAGFTVRCTRALLSPWARLSLLLVLLATAGALVLLFDPQRLLTQGWPPRAGGLMAVLAFGAGYGLCTVAFVPRPLLNLAAGALFGSRLGLGTALAGTVLGAGVAFGLGRLLGQDALRPLLRGRWLRAADGQLVSTGSGPCWPRGSSRVCRSGRRTTARRSPGWAGCRSCWRRRSGRSRTPPPTRS